MIPSLNDVSCWYVLLALGITAYQSFRGYRFQWIFQKEKTNQNDSSPPDQEKKEIKYTRAQKIFLLSIADMLFYLFTTLLGFVALFLSYHILNSIPDVVEIGAGLSALLIFLMVFGVLGISGQLPYLIQKGMFPWWKTN